MAKPNTFNVKPQVRNAQRPDPDKPSWLQHNIENLHNYTHVIIWKCKDLDKYDEGIQYQVDLTEAFSKSPIIRQATVYDDCRGSMQTAKEIHGMVAQLRASMPRLSEMQKLDWLTILRFSAVDYDDVQKQVQAHVDAVIAKMPIPDYIEKFNALYYIENHTHAKHDFFDSLSSANYVAKQGSPGSSKFGDFGFSWPSRDRFDPKMMRNYIDWYQEVRQHDVMRANFPYEIGHMWLKISSETEFGPYVMTMYEYCINDLDLKAKSMGAAYQALNLFRSDGGLYDPYIESLSGAPLVLAEFFKPY